MLKRPGRVDDRLPVQRIRQLTSSDLSAGSTAPHRTGNLQPSDLRKRLAGSADVIPNAYHVPIGKPVLGFYAATLPQVGAAGGVSMLLPIRFWGTAWAQPPPRGSLDARSIPKDVTPSSLR